MRCIQPEQENFAHLAAGRFMLQRSVGGGAMPELTVTAAVESGARAYVQGGALPVNSNGGEQSCQATVILGTAETL